MVRCGIEKGDGGGEEKLRKCGRSTMNQLVISLSSLVRLSIGTRRTLLEKSTRPARFVPEAQFHRHEHTSSDTTRNYRVHFSSELLALFLTVCGYSVDCDTEQCVLIYVGSFVPRYGDHLGQGKHRRIREQS